MPPPGAFPYHPEGACQALPKHVSSEQSVIINRNTAVPPVTPSDRLNDSAQHPSPNP